MLERTANHILQPMEEALAEMKPRLETGEIGRVKAIGNGVATVRGFTRLRSGELIRFPGELMGLAASIAAEEVGAVLLGPAGHVVEGAEVFRTHQVAEAPVGDSMLGRVVDPLGRPLDDRPAPRASDRLPAERPAPEIMHRAAVQTPLQTGIKAVDAAVPVGRGQRELIVGDRQTGKTSIAVDAILNQEGTGVLSVYCAIGQRASAVARVIDTLREAGALQRTIVVVAGGEDAPGLQYLAPYAATTMAEHFMEHGRDVLVVYDDLTRHARAYRELSLLLRRPPGREAYPGDIFYIHARLLERATHLKQDRGGGSLTALPIVETQARNISAYIPTNLISITDGQIYLSPPLFERGQLPAIDVGKSVSRVGGKAQLSAYRAVAGDLRLAYAQFEELETFSRFGTRLDEETRRKLERGRRVREILKQREHDHFAVAEQIAVLFATTAGILDAIPTARIGEAEAVIRKAVPERISEIAGRITSGERLTEEDRGTLRDAIGAALAEAGFPQDEGED